MDAQRYQQVKRLYMAAAELDARQVAAFLAAACADDESLRREVESLLAHHRPETLLVDDTQEAGAGQLVRPALDGELLNTPGGTTSTDPPRARNRSADAEPERFPPGTILAGRYRMLGLLGKGGMGEVYRADDLRLDQPVALKFLTRSRSADEDWLARFHGEVRLARRVTHPNVNRVYDIGEADGQVFLSMEYVDGENLASLLRRIGRLPIEKALPVARELCAGLGAAHDQGVLHRDLKPANVMVDGLGHARITDFGIAVTQSDTGTASPAGTPAYMAPELLNGGEASVASDIYSLGVVLHEMVTGKLPHGPGGWTDSSSASDGIELRLERVIRRCLAPDPHDRPRSTYAVLSALPGGDALAAAVAAGQTPSPEMVAAAAEEPADRRSIVALLAAAVIGLAVVFLLADSTLFLAQAGLKKPPAVLVDRAEELLKQLSHEAPQPGSASGLAVDQGYLDYVAEHPEAAKEDLPGAYFWYRQGDRRLAPPPPLGGATSSRRLPPVEGMSVVQLDGNGRLLRLAVYPRNTDRGTAVGQPYPVDWSRVFSAAGLDPADYESVAPISTPPMFADELVAWQPRDPNSSLPGVEAASTGGRIVFFDVVLPWEKTDKEAASQLLSIATGPAFVTAFWLRIITLLAAFVLAGHNLRMGRGDLRAARRLAVFVFVLAMLDWIVGEPHSSAFPEEASAALLWTSRATFLAAVAWFTYVAVEPYVRRLWPQTIVTWSRLIAGRFRDPLVGRDLLVGAVLGIALTGLQQVDVLIGKLLGSGTIVGKLPTAGQDLGELLGLRYKMGNVISEMLGAISLAMFMLLLLLLLRIAFHDSRRSAIVFCVVVATVYGLSGRIDTSMPWLLGLVTGMAVLLVVTRVGFVALAVGLFVQGLLMANPLTLDWEAWYAPAAVSAGLVTLALAGYGFYTSSLRMEPRFSTNLRTNIMRTRNVSFLVVGLALAMLCGAAAVQGADKINVLLIAGDDVAPAHDWREISESTREVLVESGKFDVRVSETPAILESPSALAAADVIVLTMFNKSLPTISDQAKENLLKFVKDGKGFYVQHLGSASFSEWDEFGKLCGRKWVMGTSGHGPRSIFPVKIVDREHPVTKGLQDFQMDDELYAKLQGDTPIHVLVAADSDWSKATEPLVFCLEYGKGRSIHNAFGHDGKAIKTPTVKQLICRSVEWAATGKVTE